MTKGINLAILELKENIIREMNTSGLPIGVHQLILSEILNTVIATNNKVIENERKALEKKEGVEDGLQQN